MEDKGLIAGIDLNAEKPEICLYGSDGKRNGARPLMIGNSYVSLSEVLDKPQEKNIAERAATLAGILREAFLTIGIREDMTDLAGIMVTVRDLTPAVIRMLRKTFQRLRIPRSKFYMQDYKESLFTYFMYQRQAIWNRRVGVFVFEEENVRFYSMNIDRTRRPMPASVTEERETVLPDAAEQKDAAFGRYAESCLKKDLYSSIFLLGDGFDESWASASLKILSAGGRRVYTETGFFAKGACNAMREKLLEKKISGITYAGDTYAQFSVGMRVQRSGKTDDFCMIDAGAGVHWYDAGYEGDLILGDQPVLTFQIRKNGEKNSYEKELKLTGMPERPERASRIHLRLEFTSGETCEARVEDLGFGEIFPSSGRKWHEVLEAKS